MGEKSVLLDRWGGMIYSTNPTGGVFNESFFVDCSRCVVFPDCRARCAFEKILLSGEWAQT